MVLFIWARSTSSRNLKLSHKYVTNIPSILVDLFLLKPNTMVRKSSRVTVGRNADDAFLFVSLTGAIPCREVSVIEDAKKNENNSLLLLSQDRSLSLGVLQRFFMYSMALIYYCPRFFRAGTCLQNFFSEILPLGRTY